jgi:hypothetical protein
LPARLLFGARIGGAALAAACLMLAIAAARLFAGEQDSYTAQNACDAIKSAVGVLADAERAEALGLNLTTEKATPAVVEVRLNDLIERSDQLSATIRAVRMSSVAHDSEVGDCLAMGERTLASAQKLCSDVEEILYASESPIADAPPPVRLGEPAPGQSREP